MGNAPLHYLKNPPPELPSDAAAAAATNRHGRVKGGGLEAPEEANCATSISSTDEAASTSSPKSHDKRSGSGGGGSFRFHHRLHGTGGSGRHSLRTFEGLVKRAAAAHSHSHQKSKSRHSKGGGTSNQGADAPLSPRSRRRREHRLARARERVGRHLLHDCRDVEEHLAKVEELCGRARGLRGAEALSAMGFEYRIVHGMRCDCDGVQGSRGEEGVDDVGEVMASSSATANTAALAKEGPKNVGCEAAAPTSSGADATTSTSAEEGGPSKSTTSSSPRGGALLPPPIPQLHPMLASQPRSISMELREAMEHWNVGHSHDVSPGGSGMMSQLTSACASPLTVNDEGSGGEVEMTESSGGSEGGGEEDESSSSCSSASSSSSATVEDRRPRRQVAEAGSTAGDATTTTTTSDGRPPRLGGASVASVASAASAGGGIELTDDGNGAAERAEGGEERASITRCETAEALLRGSSSSSDSDGLAVPLGDKSDHGTAVEKSGTAEAVAAAANGRDGDEHEHEEKKEDDGGGGVGGDGALLEGFGDHVPGHITRVEGQEEEDNPDSTTTAQSKSPSDGISAPAASMKERLQQHSQYHHHVSPEDAEDCTIRLIHIESGTIITDDNRRLYVADGDMYETLTNAAQEYSQDLMVEEGDLEWITICDDKTRGEPIRALVDRRRKEPSSSADDADADDAPPSSSSTSTTTPTPADEKTLLIATGKGKVRAGIFSRKHLLTTGIEPSTALPLVQQARRRNMRIVILDPNARGERLGMDTFEMSMEKIFVAAKDDDKKEDCTRPSSSSTGEDPGAIDDAAIGGGESISTSSTYQVGNNTNGLYILAHSASGAQLVRYFLDKQLHPTGSGAVAAPAEATSRNLKSGTIQSRAIVQTQQHHDGADSSSSAAFRVEAIAFTDSTHNVQWTKKNPCLRRLLEDDNSMYLRSAHQHDSKPEEWHRSQTGAPVDTDEHWKHRFGDVKTMWAGTKAHELINWTGRQQIWDHFDAKSGTNSGSDDGGSSEPSNESDTKKGDRLLLENSK